jgi:hypothetical protein
VGFEPTISAGERPKTYALDRATTGTGRDEVTVAKYHIPVQQEGKTCNEHINVTFRSVRLTILLPWKSNNYYIFSVRVCSLSYPACKAHEPYYIVIRGLFGSAVRFHVVS